MKKLLFVLIALAVMVFPAAALNSVSSLMPYLGDEALKLMTDEGMSLSNSTLADGIMHLVPIGSKIAQRAVEASGEENSFTVALVGFTAYPESWNNLSQEERMVKLLNMMTAVSKQEGAMYISRTAGNKPKVLLEKSYCISDLSKSNSRIDDPVYDSVPENLTLYAYQKDNRFGGNTFVVDYTCTDREIMMKITNHTAMKFMGITCVPEGKLSMYIDAFCTEEGIVISGLATVYDRKPTVNLVFYTVDIAESFKRRIMGLKDKFIENIME